MIDSTNEFKNNIYAISRQIDAQIDLTYLGVKTTYDDTRITKLNIVEERSNLNDTLPSDQLTLSLDNRDGTFQNFLALSNMQQIIASRPRIDVRLGLMIPDKVTTVTTYTFRFIRDWTNGNTVNAWNYWNEIKCMSGTINRAKGKPVISNTTKTLNNSANLNDEILTNYCYETSVGTPIYVQIDLGAVYSDIDTINVWHFYQDGRTFHGTKTEISQDGTNWTTIRDSAVSGEYVETSAGQTYTQNLTIDTPAHEEWIPMGSFFVDQIKNDAGGLTLTLTAHDNLTMLENVSYGKAGAGKGMTLYDLAVDVFKIAKITDYSIDTSLKNITTATGFNDVLTCRVALQHIGILARSAVYQDRNGFMQIKTLATLDASSSFYTYARTQLGGLYAGYSSISTSSAPARTTGGGMKLITFDNIYDIPEVSLDKSLFQLNVKIYAPDGTSTENIYTNANMPIINATNGDSFSIDNPLISSTAQANTVAQWFISESNYNAVYKTNWRQNPVLESTDMVIIQDNFNTNRQTRIYHNEFVYEGALSGTTESRGGI